MTNKSISKPNWPNVSGRTNSVMAKRSVADHQQLSGYRICRLDGFGSKMEEDRWLCWRWATCWQVKTRWRWEKRCYTSHRISDPYTALINHLRDLGGGRKTCEWYHDRTCRSGKNWQGHTRVQDYKPSPTTLITRRLTIEAANEPFNQRLRWPISSGADSGTSVSALLGLT